MGLLGNLKKRRDCDEKEEEPKLEDLHEAINKSISSKITDPDNLPISKFMKKWEKLGKSWLRRLICHDLQSPLGKQLLPKKKPFISLLAWLSTCNTKFAQNLGFAFGCDASTIRKIRYSEAALFSTNG
jgi:hypothetical protein